MNTLGWSGSLVLLLTLAVLTPLEGGAPNHPAANNRPEALPLSRDGGAYGLGQIWFDREPPPDTESTKSIPSPQELTAKPAETTTTAETAATLGFSWTLTSTAIYETHPAKYTSSRPDWHWDSELSLEAAWEIDEHFTLTPSTGMHWARYASQKDLSSDEPFVSLQGTWRFADGWMSSFRHESFWGFAPLNLPAGYSAKQFAAHTTVTRLQYDTTRAESMNPVRWQIYAEAAQSFAEPQTHNYIGAAMGTGVALRLCPQRLSLQIGAGISYQKYPNYHVPAGDIREGWNGHATAALVWTPTAHAQVTAGLQWMRSRENGREFRFDNFVVPLSITVSF